MESWDWAKLHFWVDCSCKIQYVIHVCLSTEGNYIVNVRLTCICPGGGRVYWKNIYVNKSWKNKTQTFRGFLLFLNKRGLSTGWKMFSESKLGPLISFSWPLLKLKPQISPGCYGLHGLLITLVRASLWREGKGWGLREVWGTTQAETSPSCQLLGCKGKPAESPDVLPLLTVDLSLAGGVCSSLPELLMGHGAVPGGTKLNSSVGGHSPKKNSLNVGFTVKYVAWKMNP